MTTKQAIEKLQGLGYVAGEAAEIGGAMTYVVRGFGVETYLDADELQAFAADDAAHAERVAEREAADADPDPAKVATFEAEGANETTLRDRVRTMGDELAADHAGWAGLSAAQKDRATRNTIRLVLAIARLVLRRFDSAGS